MPIIPAFKLKSFPCALNELITSLLHTVHSSLSYILSSLIPKSLANILFIKNSKVLLFIFRITCLIAVFLGAQADFSVVWNIADITMGLMATVNIISILLLGNIAIKVLKDYEKQLKANKDPKFHAKELGIDNTDCWND